MTGLRKHYCIKEKESKAVQTFPMGKVPARFPVGGGVGALFLPKARTSQEKEQLLPPLRTSVRKGWNCTGGRGGRPRQSGQVAPLTWAGIEPDWLDGLREIRRNGRKMEKHGKGEVSNPQRSP